MQTIANILSMKGVNAMENANVFAPLSTLAWVDRDKLKPNDYNPIR